MGLDELCTTGRTSKPSLLTKRGVSSRVFPGVDGNTIGQLATAADVASASGPSAHSSNISAPPEYEENTPVQPESSSSSSCCSVILFFMTRLLGPRQQMTVMALILLLVMAMIVNEKSPSRQIVISSLRRPHPPNRGSYLAKVMI